MSAAQEQPSGVGAAGRPSAPPFPATSAEVVNTLAHFHRAEIGRMAGWRDRIDRLGTASRRASPPPGCWTRGREPDAETTRLTWEAVRAARRAADG
jgi:hypothetical protein